LTGLSTENTLLGACRERWAEEKQMVIPQNERLQIVLSMYEVQHSLLQSFRQIYLTAEVFLLAATVFLLGSPLSSPALTYALVAFGMALCPVWSWQCCQRGRTWRYFRGIMREYEETESLPDKVLAEYEDRFRGMGYCRQRTILEDLGRKRQRCPLRWSPAVVIDVLVPLVGFMGVWIALLVLAATGRV
jgi:hypothetical protein